MVTLAFYAIIEQLVIFRHATNTYEVNTATSWMISRIKKVNIELFFYFFFRMWTKHRELSLRLHKPVTDLLETLPHSSDGLNM